MPWMRPHHPPKSRPSTLPSPSPSSLKEGCENGGVERLQASQELQFQALWGRGVLSSRRPRVCRPGKCGGSILGRGGEGRWMSLGGGGRDSGLIAFWNLWNLWIQINLHNWSQSLKGIPGPQLLITGSAGQAFWVRAPWSPVNPLHVRNLCFTVQRHIVCPFSLSFYLLSVCLFICLWDLYVYKLMSTSIHTNAN